MAVNNTWIHDLTFIWATLSSSSFLKASGAFQKSRAERQKQMGEGSQSASTTECLRLNRIKSLENIIKNVQLQKSPIWKQFKKNGHIAHHIYCHIYCSEDRAATHPLVAVFSLQVKGSSKHPSQRHPKSKYSLIDKWNIYSKGSSTLSRMEHFTLRGYKSHCISSVIEMNNSTSHILS